MHEGIEKHDRGGGEGGGTRGGTARGEWGEGGGDVRGEKAVTCEEVPGEKTTATHGRQSARIWGESGSDTGVRREGDRGAGTCWYTSR